MNISKTVLLLSLLLLTQDLFAASLSGRPSRIISGDKLVLSTGDNKHIQVQLLGIKAPPPSTPMGRAAKKRLSALVAGKPVIVHFLVRNRWGHPIGKVILGDTDINLQLLSIGLATHKPDFQTVLDNSLYSQSTQRAKRQKLGIWALSNRPNQPLKPYVTNR
jgi:endonuclease YncB( thermonuclease family)